MASLANCSLMKAGVFGVRGTPVRTPSPGALNMLQIVVGLAQICIIIS